MTPISLAVAANSSPNNLSEYDDACPTTLLTHRCNSESTFEAFDFRLVHQKDIALQRAADDACGIRASAFGKKLACVFGNTFTRRFSNAIACTGLRHFFPAVRSYDVLPPNAKLTSSDGSVIIMNGFHLSADRLAHLLKPIVFTINSSRLNNGDLSPSTLWYEVLPPSDHQQQYYSIKYYIGCNDEDHPHSMINRLYDAVRPILWGSKRDVEALKVQFDRDSGQVHSLTFESSNYSADPKSYYASGTRTTHQLREVTNNYDGTWSYVPAQDAYPIAAEKLKNPLGEFEHPELVFVSWNGAFDLRERVQNKGHASLRTEQPILQFLDAYTYTREGMDLRNRRLSSANQS